MKGTSTVARWTWGREHVGICGVQACLVYFSLEQAYDVTGYLRPTLHAFRQEYVDAVREGLEVLLRGQSFTVEDYERLTGIEFEHEGALYEYLRDINLDLS